MAAPSTSGHHLSSHRNHSLSLSLGSPHRHAHRNHSLHASSLSPGSPHWHESVVHVFLIATADGRTNSTQLYSDARELGGSLAARSGAPLPWTLRVHVVWSVPWRDAGWCTAEALPMLRALAEHYDDILPEHLVVFAHAHRTSWHAPTPLDQALGSVLANTTYLADTAASGVGGIYCKFASMWAAKQHAYAVANRMFEPNEPKPHSERAVQAAVDALWNVAFNGTGWASKPLAAAVVRDDHGMSYPCCGTFFVRGANVRRHARHEYSRVATNLLRACQAGQDNRSSRGHILYPERLPARTNTSWLQNLDCSAADPEDFVPLPPQAVRAAKVMEGSWHWMLGGTTHVTPPPWCASEWSSDIAKKKKTAEHAVKRLDNARSACLKAQRAQGKQVRWSAAMTLVLPFAWFALYRRCGRGGAAEGDAVEEPSYHPYRAAARGLSTLGTALWRRGSPAERSTYT